MSTTTTEPKAWLSTDSLTEVPPGYKRTEVGVIPDGWKLKPFSTLLDFRNGVNADKQAYGEGTPFINVLEVITYSHLRATDIPGRITLPKRAVEAFSVRAGDLLFNRTSETQEEVGLVAVYQDEEQIVFGGFVIRGRPKTGELDADYSGYALRAPIVHSQVIRKGQGAIRANVGQADLREIFVPIPPLPEQRAIAKALLDVDALIGALDKLISKKRAIKQAAMQQLLTGKTRLPGFSREWEMISLGDLFTFKNGLNKGKEFFGRGTPIVNYMDVYGCSTLKSGTLQGRVSLTKQELNTFDVWRGDVFFTRTSETVDEIGIAAVMLDDPENTVFSGFLLRARPKDNRLCDDFKRYCFAAQRVRAQIISHASYTTRALTNGRLLSAVMLQMPSPLEQQAIATVLSDMDAEIAALERRHDKTRAIKQGMMQQLLTGKVRLV